MEELEKMEKRLEQKMAVKESRSYVYNQRKTQEKLHRDQRKENGKRRRNETLYRASQPQTKQSKLVKKQARNEARNLLKSVRDVSIKHNEIINTFEMMQVDKYKLGQEMINAYENYKSNYKDWQYAKDQSLYQASLLDLKYKEKTEREKKKADEEKIFKNHKARFYKTLIQISPSHQKGEKIEEVKKKSTVINQFFKRVAGFYKEKTESRFNSFYFNSIVDVKTRVHVFPEVFNEDEENEKKTEKQYHETDNEYACDNCDTGMIVDSKIGVLCCPSCGITKSGGFGIGLKQTFSESQSSTRSAAPYDRLAHVSYYFFSFFFLFQILE